MNKSIKKSNFHSEIQLSLNYKSKVIQSTKTVRTFIHSNFNSNRKPTHSNTNQSTPHQQIMEGKHQYQNQDFQSEDENNHLQEYFLKQKLRKQAYNRKTEYVHTPVNFFDHQQINSKQSEQLRHQLVGLYKPKVEMMRTKFDLEEMQKDYQKNYEEFIKMTLKNQIQQRQLTESISQMHQMADVLLNVPSFDDGNLYLDSKAEPSPTQQQEIDRIFNLYQIAYKQGQQVEQNHAQQTIRKAKQFLRDRYT